MHSYTDFLILLVASFIIGCLFASTWSSSEHNGNLLILQSAHYNHSIDLKHNGVYSFKSLLGVSEIEVKNRTARFIKSECENKVCIQNGWLSSLRPVIACIPNGISIQLHDSTTAGPVFDALVF